MVAPLTFREASVPRLVTFGWAAVTSEPTIEVRLD